MLGKCILSRSGTIFAVNFILKCFCQGSIDQIHSECYLKQMGSLHNQTVESGVQAPIHTASNEQSAWHQDVESRLQTIQNKLTEVRYDSSIPQ